MTRREMTIDPARPDLARNMVNSARFYGFGTTTARGCLIRKADDGNLVRELEGRNRPCHAWLTGSCRRLMDEAGYASAIRISFPCAAPIIEFKKGISPCKHEARNTFSASETGEALKRAVDVARHM